MKIIITKGAAHTEHPQGRSRNNRNSKGFDNGAAGLGGGGGVPPRGSAVAGYSLHHYNAPAASALPG